MKYLENIWYNLPIRKKLLLYFTLLAVVMSLLTIGAFGITYRYANSFQNMLKEYFLLNTFLSKLQTHGNFANAVLRSHAENLRYENIRSLRSDYHEMKLLLKHIKNHGKRSTKIIFEIRALENCLEVYTALSIDLFLSPQKLIPQFFQQVEKLSRIQHYMEQYIANLQGLQLADDTLYWNYIKTNIVFFRFIFLTVLMTLFICLVIFAYIFSRRFSEPITKMAEISLSMAAGNLSAEPIEHSYKNGKEIDMVVSAFNIMSRNIKNMVDSLHKKAQLEKLIHAKEIEKELTVTALREAQLINLHNQIKPHFLFNTLNMIMRLAQEEHAPQTAHLLILLSHLMRYNLLSNNVSVSLHDEVTALQYYIQLQQKRFGERIQYTIEYAEELLPMDIPPFSLLTFAENAVRHGLEPSICGGHLYIYIRKHGSRCKIHIADTGVGMDKAVLNKIRLTYSEKETLKNNEMKAGIGISNTIKRLQLFYGKRFLFRCYSKQKRGTLMILSLPLYTKN